MRKLILLAHISLDGFMANEQGNLNDFAPSEDSLQFVCKLTNGADAAFFGRISYQLLDDYWPYAYQRENATQSEIAFSNWYNQVHKIVVSKSLTEGKLKNTTVINNDISNEVLKIKNQIGKNILVFGAPSVSHELMRHNLIDDYFIFINPIIFGKGIPLFVELQNKITLRLLDTSKFSNGEFVLHFILEK